MATDAPPRPTDAGTDPAASTPPDGPTRVLYVHNTGDIYGASKALLRLVRTADRNRVEPIVVIPQDGPIRPALEAHGVEVVIDPSVCMLERANFRPAGLLRLAVQF